MAENSNYETFVSRVEKKYLFENIIKPWQLWLGLDASICWKIVDWSMTGILSSNNYFCKNKSQKESEKRKSFNKSFDLKISWNFTKKKKTSLYFWTSSQMITIQIISRCTVCIFSLTKSKCRHLRPAPRLRILSFKLSML